MEFYDRLLNITHWTLANHPVNNKGNILRVKFYLNSANTDTVFLRIFRRLLDGRIPLQILPLAIFLGQQ